MAKNEQSRKYLLTINNPADCGLTHDKIKTLVQSLSPAYFCMADEIAATGTHHTHVFLYRPSPVRWHTVKNLFPTAHIEKAYGSVQENRDYIQKGGKWSDTDKAETTVTGSFEEFGHMPLPQSEKAPEMTVLLEDIAAGKTTSQIIRENPKLAFRVKEIDVLRQTLLSEKYAEQNRIVETQYLYGATGTGKTSGIYRRHDPRDIYRVTNYRNGRGVSFDDYHGQDVIVFEEFASQIPIEEMLNLLDIYPLMLPARYSDKVACYTKVYITSNLPLSRQYQAVQQYHPETWKAFLRRIRTFTEYRENGAPITRPISEWRWMLEDG